MPKNKGYNEKNAGHDAFRKAYGSRKRSVSTSTPSKGTRKSEASGGGGGGQKKKKY